MIRPALTINYILDKALLSGGFDDFTSREFLEAQKIFSHDENKSSLLTYLDNYIKIQKNPEDGATSEKLLNEIRDELSKTAKERLNLESLMTAEDVDFPGSDKKDEAYSINLSRISDFFDLLFHQVIPLFRTETESKIVSHHLLFKAFVLGAQSKLKKEGDAAYDVFYNTLRSDLFKTFFPDGLFDEQGYPKTDVETAEKSIPALFNRPYGMIYYAIFSDNNAENSEIKKIIAQLAKYEPTEEGFQTAQAEYFDMAALKQIINHIYDIGFEGLTAEELQFATAALKKDMDNKPSPSGPFLKAFASVASDTAKRNPDGTNPREPSPIWKDFSGRHGTIEIEVLYKKFEEATTKQTAIETQEKENAEKAAKSPTETQSQQDPQTERHQHLSDDHSSHPPTQTHRDENAFQSLPSTPRAKSAVDDDKNEYDINPLMAELGWDHDRTASAIENTLPVDAEQPLVSVTLPSEFSKVEITPTLILNTLWGEKNDSDTPTADSTCGKLLASWKKEDSYPAFAKPEEKNIHINNEGRDIEIQLQVKFDENKSSGINLTRTADAAAQTETWTCSPSDDLFDIQKQYELIAAESLALRKAQFMSNPEVVVIDDINDGVSKKKSASASFECKKPIDLTEREEILLKAHFKMGYKEIVYKNISLSLKNPVPISDVVSAMESNSPSPHSSSKPPRFG